MRTINKIWLAIIVFYLALFTGLALFDEHPSKEMLENLNRPLPVVIEPGNAWIVFFGFSAPQGVSPYTYGEKKMLGLKDMIDSAKSYQEQNRLFSDDRTTELAFKGKMPFFYDSKESGMLKYAKTHNKEVARLIRDNREQLNRYESLRNYPRYAEPLDYGLSAPIPRFSSIRETQRLRLLLLAEIASKGRYADALTGLRDDMEFWRFIASNSNLLISKLMSISFLYKDIQFAAELGVKLPLSKREQIMLFSIMRPFDKGETEMRGAFMGEIRLMQKGMEKVYISSQRTIERFFFKPNRTDNLFYGNWTGIIKDTELSPQEIAAEMERTKNTVKIRDKIGFGFLYNPVGEILAVIGKANTSAYIVKGCDLEGYRRLALLKIFIRHEKILPTNIQQFLDSRKADLGNPYTGEPMKWDPDKQSLYFNKLSGDGRVEIFLQGQ
jgi:hypothetical protein